MNRNRARCFILTLAVMALITSPAIGAVLDYPAAGVSLQTPPGWILRNSDEGPFLFLQGSVNAMSKIHFVPLQDASGTLDAVMKEDIDSIMKNSSKWVSGTERNSFLGSYPVKTQSGLDGIEADFGFTNSAAFTGNLGYNHNVVRFYFRTKSGQAFKVCAHVYAGDSMLRYYEAVILNGLKATR